MANNHVRHSTSGRCSDASAGASTPTPWLQNRDPTSTGAPRPLKASRQVCVGQKPRGDLGPGRDRGGKRFSPHPSFLSFSKCLQTKNSNSSGSSVSWWLAGDSPSSVCPFSAC